MQKTILLERFGTWSEAARQLRVSRQAVHKFKDTLPLRIAVRMHVEHGVPLDLEVYAGSGKGPAQD